MEYNLADLADLAMSVTSEQAAATSFLWIELLRGLRFWQEQTIYRESLCNFNSYFRALIGLCILGHVNWKPPKYNTVEEDIMVKMRG